MRVWKRDQTSKFERWEAIICSVINSYSNIKPSIRFPTNWPRLRSQSVTVHSQITAHEYFPSLALFAPLLAASGGRLSCPDTMLQTDKSSHRRGFVNTYYLSWQQGSYATIQLLNSKISYPTRWVSLYLARGPRLSQRTYSNMHVGYCRRLPGQFGSLEIQYLSFLPKYTYGSKKMLNKDECTPIPPRLNLQQYAFVHYHKGAFANTQRRGRGREIEGGERETADVDVWECQVLCEVSYPHAAIRKVPLLWLLCLLAPQLLGVSLSWLCL